MTLIRLVRHGRAAAGWDADPDPPLDTLGRQQADDAARRLSPLGPLPVISSPLLRCRATAEPLASRWQTPVVVNAGVAEIPSPEGWAMSDRVDWLRNAMRGTWVELGDRYTTFRDRVVATVTDLSVQHPDGCVVFSHFVAINAVIGAALGDDRLVIRSLDNASVTTVSVDGSTIRLVEAGHEADTLIR